MMLMVGPYSFILSDNIIILLYKFPLYQITNEVDYDVDGG